MHHFMEFKLDTFFRIPRPRLDSCRLRPELWQSGSLAAGDKAAFGL